MLLMNLESRPVVFEDIGRQVLATGERLSAKYYYDKIGECFLHCAVIEINFEQVYRGLLTELVLVTLESTTELVSPYGNRKLIQ